MSLSIHDATVPVLVRALTNLVNVLDKGSAYAEAEKIDPAVLISMRLYPDMFPLTRQVQIVSDQAKGGVARLIGQEPPKWPDSEASFAELKERIQKTIAFVQAADAGKFEGAETRPVTLKFPNGALNFKSGWDYLSKFVLPNVYFHSTTTYGILRHCGVKLTKGDFIGPTDG